MKYLRERPAVFIFVFALIVRIVFLYLGTPFYFGSTGIQVLPDVGWWRDGVINFIQSGVYTSNPESTFGAFTRPPGYSIFLYPLYLVFGEWEDVYVAAVVIQIILDSFTAVLAFRIVYLTTKHFGASIFTGSLFAVYVFSFGWTCVTYPETLSLFFLVLATHLLLKGLTKGNNLNLFLAGACLGFAALLRIQLLMLVPIPIFLWLVQNRNCTALRLSFIYGLGILLTYGLWPIRNYFLHGEIVFAQKLDDEGLWAKDFVAFRDFVWAVKTDIEPELTQLVRGDSIHWPKSANLNEYDRELIDSAMVLMNKCGIGTQAWRSSRGYGDKVSVQDPCQDKIQNIWGSLIKRQQTENPINYYWNVPMSNMKKAFFKNGFITGEGSQIAKRSKNENIAVLAFGIRSVLIVLGIICCMYITLSSKVAIVRKATILILVFFLVEYVFFTFYFRSMEMRYLMQVDALMLIPVGIVVSMINRKN